MELYSILKEEHEKVKRLFSEGMETTDKTVYDELKNDLLKHMKAEEEHLYPRLRDIGEARMIALEAEEEHKAARELMLKMDKETAEDMWWAKFKVLKEQVEHHIEEEESELFPKAQSLIGKDEAEKIAERFA